MNCKKCEHYEICCDNHIDFEFMSEQAGSGCICKHFKDKSRFIELPCKVGDTVYVLGCNGIEEKTIRGFYINAYLIHTVFMDDYISHYYDKMFLTKAEAEQALKEHEQNEK